MKLSEAIRLGSLAIQEPKAGSSESCAIGMAAMSIGEHAIGTTILTAADPNLMAVVKQWPWCGEGSSPWNEHISYKQTPIGRIAIMFDAKVAPDYGEAVMTIEQLCDMVAGWESRLESRGINVEQVTMAAELTEPASPTQSIEKELAVATPRGGETHDPHD